MEAWKVLLVELLCLTSLAAVHGVQTGSEVRIASCLEKMEEQFRGTKVPETAVGLVEEARSYINPDNSMTENLFSVENNEATDSFLREATRSINRQLLNDCRRFNAVSLAKLNSLSCFAELLEEPGDQFDEFKARLGENKFLDELVGAINLCGVLVHHQAGPPSLVPTRR